MVVALALIPGAHFVVETDRARFGFPFKPLETSGAAMRGDDAEKLGPDLLPHPRRLDPKVVEPPNAIARERARPSNDLTVNFRDDVVCDLIASAVRSSVSPHARTSSRL
jgi:hypothetical protein